MKKGKLLRFAFTLLAMILIGCFTFEFEPALASKLASYKKVEPVYKVADHITLSPNPYDINITIDADIVMPKTSTFSTYEIKPKKLTQDKVDAFLDSSFPNRKGIYKDKTDLPPTKSEIECEIKKREGWIEEAKNNKDKQNLVARWKNHIAQYKEILDDAPEKKSYFNSLTPYYNFKNIFSIDSDRVYYIRMPFNDIEEMKKLNKKQLNYKFDNLGQKYSISAYQDDKSGNYLSVNREGFEPSYTKENYTENYVDIKDLRPTYEEAKLYCYRALSSIGIDYTGVFTSNIYKDNSEMYYHFLFTREIDGTLQNYAATNPFSVTDVYEFWIDNDDIAKAVMYDTGTEITKTLTRKKKMLSIDKMLVKAIKEFEDPIYKYQLPFYPHYEDNIAFYENDIIIDKIKLGYMILKDDEFRENGVFTLVPVWDFYGRESYTAEAHYSEYDKQWIEDTMPEKGGFKSFLTVNALDGSIIYRRKHY